MAIWHVERDGGDRELIEMVYRQRGKTLLNAGDGAKRDDPAVAAGQAKGVQRGKPRRTGGIMFQHHPILVCLGVDG
ncbi:hypothetical protein D3C81_2119960 [compost metagenome]